MISLKVASVEDHGKQERGNESCWQGETLAEVITGWNSAQLDYQVALVHPIQSILWTASYKDLSHQAPSRLHHDILQQNLLREESTLKFPSLLLPSFFPYFYPSVSPFLSFLYPFLSFCTSLSFCLFFREDLYWAGCPQTCYLLVVLPQSILITSVHHHHTILFPTLNIKLEIK